MDHILIIGSKSDIARAIAHKFAREGFSIILAARESADLENDARDLQIRYRVNAEITEFDALNYHTHLDFYTRLKEKPLGVVCAVGYLGDQKRAEQQYDEAKKIIDTNYTGCVSILNIVANDLEVRKAGFIIGISSVAGDRGRQSNYFYGSAKSAFTTYLSGLRNRLQKYGVRVITVKPGYVETKMTEGLELPQLLTCKPDDVAEDILKAYIAGKDVIYSKWIWKWIMVVIRMIPERVFKRLNL